MIRCRGTFSRREEDNDPNARWEKTIKQPLSQNNPSSRSISHRTIHGTTPLALVSYAYSWIYSGGDRNLLYQRVRKEAGFQEEKFYDVFHQTPCPCVSRKTQILEEQHSGSTSLMGKYERMPLKYCHIWDQTIYGKESFFQSQIKKFEINKRVTV